MNFVEGIKEPEGPVVLSDGSWLCVEMAADMGCVTHISKDGKSRRKVIKTGRPNGLAVDKEGYIWVAESQIPSLLRVTMDGDLYVLLTERGDEVFLFPNDLAFGPDGWLYMTDSGISHKNFVIGGKIREDYKTAPYDGRVYRINTKTREIQKLDTGIKFPNGIAFDAKGNLYVNETVGGNVYRYQAKGKGKFGPRELFGNVIDPKGPDIFKGPDGMKFGADGNLYVTVYNQSDVTVLGPDGKVVKRIKLAGNNPTNLAFGLPGDKRIYVTEVQLGTMEIIDVGCEGLPLHK
jgi:gluconolactonase